MGRNKSYNKTEVLEKALSTFWLKGYENTSMRDLSKSTGINVYSIYSEFTDKENLFKEVLKSYQKSNYDFAKSVLSSNGSGFERLESLFTRLSKSIKEDTQCKGCLTVKTANSTNSLGKPIIDLLSKNDTDFIELFENTVKIGQSDGSITKKVSSFELASFLYSSHHGLRTVQQSTKNDIIINGIINSILELIKP